MADDERDDHRDEQFDHFAPRDNYGGHVGVIVTANGSARVH